MLIERYKNAEWQFQFIGGNKMGIEIKLLELNKNRMKELGSLAGEYFLMKDVQQKLTKINAKLKNHQYLICGEEITIGKKECCCNIGPNLPVAKIIYKE